MAAEEGAQGVQELEEVMRLAGLGRVVDWREDAGDHDAVDLLRAGCCEVGMQRVQGFSEGGGGWGGVDGMVSDLCG